MFQILYKCSTDNIRFNKSKHNFRNDHIRIAKTRIERES